MEVDISLDMVSFVGRPARSWGAVDEYLVCEREGDTESVRALSSLGLGQDRSRIAWVVDGAHISCLCEHTTLWHCWTEVVSDEEPNPMRIEFNPNKVTERVLRVVRMMDVAKCTRADVALDYPGVAIGDYEFRRDRVKPTWFFGPGFEGVEGLYLGRRTSDRFVRVYDKAKELGLDEVLTRIEGVGRHRYVLQEALFDGIGIHAPRIPRHLSTREAGLVALALHAPDALGRADRDTRKRAKNLLGECCAQLSPHPAEVYRDQRLTLGRRLDVLAHGGGVPQAIVYQRNAPEGSQPLRRDAVVAAIDRIPVEAENVT